MPSLTKKKHDIQRFRDGIRSNLEKQGIEEKQKNIVLLISANKCFLCSGIHFYETAIIFLSFYEVLAKSLRF